MVLSPALLRCGRGIVETEQYNNPIIRRAPNICNKRKMFNKLMNTKQNNSINVESFVFESFHFMIR